MNTDTRGFKIQTGDMGQQPPPPLPFVKRALFLGMKIECSPKTWFIPQTVKFDPSELLPLPST